MPEKVEQEMKLFAAVFIPHHTPENPIWSMSEGGTGVDKMEVPTEYPDVVELCRFFYDHDGLAYTTINKQVEIGINGYGVNPGTCSSNELAVYESLNETIEQFLREAALEFLVSGLVIPEVTWDTVSGPEVKSRLRKRYELPVDLWHRDPLSIDLKKTPLPNQIATFVIISEDDIAFITSGGVYADGTKDVEIYRLLAKKYPDFVAAVKRGQEKFKLDDPLLIRRCPRSGSVYPTPYLLPALELFMHKRNLRKMDYAIASRVISAIQLFRLGNDEYPLTEDDEDVVEALKQQMLWRGVEGNTERVFQLFSNHTLDISWITPNVEALLDEGKYRTINSDIISALGLPRIIVSGEALRSGSTNSEMALLPPANTIESMRRQLLAFPRKLYGEIRNRNRFKGVPEPYYPPIRLQSLRELIEYGQSFYENGVISRTGWAEMGGFDFPTEMQRMVLEREEMEKLGLDERPDVPYSPKPNKVSTRGGQNSEEK